MTLLRRLLQFPLHVWHRFIAPLFPPMCRFEPSCSVFAVEAIEKHRLDRAFVLIVRRVLACNPFHPGGIDPVPEVEEIRGRRLFTRRHGAAAGRQHQVSHPAGECAAGHSHENLSGRS